LCPRKGEDNTMDPWELLSTSFVSISVFLALHVAIFLLVRWMYPPTVMAAPMLMPPEVPKVVAAAAAPPPQQPAPPAEPPLPEYYTQPAKKVNAPPKADEVTLPMAPPGQEGATNISDL